MQCRACASDIPDASRYCPSCGARVDQTHAATLTAAPADLLRSSALDGAQFVPGTILADRYRIVGLLGRGGMGEVYRADDLKLGQPVALKFLPKDVGKRPDQLARFYQEVRVARQVTHPNVCRVYDIVDASGQLFIAMEYIDGENLASLLRRVGRLPQHKALEMAQEICAGLAAAHERQVLHRDLKPANVVIDGRGHAHLLDFGLAQLLETKPDEREFAGTPAYMAPEQRERRELTTRTDLYALGLVLYEMFTGKHAFESDQARGTFNTGVVDSPSTHVPDLDHAVERVIVRCLERDPARRPASALAVAAALPGGDALAAAISAGQTPSPEMVAAAGEPGTLSPSVGAACFAAVVLGVIVLGPLTRDTTVIGLTRIDRSPQALTERAHALVKRLGYTEPALDEVVGYATDIDYLREIDERDLTPGRWRSLAASQPPALLFWYRQSPRPLVPIGGTIIVTQTNPPATRSGMVSLVLDRTGRLVNLIAVPPQVQKTPDGEAGPPFDPWAVLFSEAGLPLAKFSPRVPERIPPVFADSRAAWTGSYPDRPEIPIRIEAAAVAGRPVYFETVAPWTRVTNEEPEPGRTAGERISVLTRTMVGPLVLLLGLVLALRNLRTGRGDKRGALRVAVFLLAAGTASFALETGDLQVLSKGPTVLFFVPAAMWLLYIALEPHMRRIWPGIMFGWSRMLAGHFFDPLVGRDVLVGVIVAIGNALIVGGIAAGRRWAGRPPPFPSGASADPFNGMAASSDFLLGGRFAASRIIGSMTSIPVLVATMGAFLLLLVLFAALRRRTAAIGAMVVLLTAAYVATHGGWILPSAPADHSAPSIVDVAIFAMVQTIVVIVAVRFGVLTMLVAAFVSTLLTIVPVTFDPSAPYASSSWLTLSVVIALAAYGWHTALGGRPMFGPVFSGEDPLRRT